MAMRILLALIFSVSLACQAAPPWVWMSAPPSSSGPTTHYVYDSFQRVNASPISNPASDGSSTWSTNTGHFGTLQIVSSNVVTVSAVDSAEVISSPTFSANQMATITNAVTGSSYIGVCVRMQPNSGSCYIAYVTGTPSEILIRYVTDSGSLNYTTIADVTGLVNIDNAGSSFGLKVSGSTLTLYTNGVAYGTTWTDTHFTTGQPSLFDAATAANAKISGFSAQDGL